MESGPPFSLADDDIIYLWVLLRITCDNVCKELGHSPPTVTLFFFCPHEMGNEWFIQIVAVSPSSSDSQTVYVKCPKNKKLSTHPLFI